MVHFTMTIILKLDPLRRSLDLRGFGLARTLEERDSGILAEMGSPIQSLPVIDLLKRSWAHVDRRRRTHLSWLVLLLLFTSVAEVFSIGTLLPFMSILVSPDEFLGKPYAQPLIRFLGTADQDTLLRFVTIVFCAGIILSGVMRVMLHWAQIRVSHAIGTDFSIEIYERSLYQPYEVHTARNSSEVISAIATKSTRVIYDVILPILMLVSSVLIAIVIMSFLIVLSPSVALVCLVGFGSIYLVITATTKDRLRTYSREISRQQDQVIKVLQEGFGGIRDILVDGSQDIYKRVYQETDVALRTAQANVQILGGAPRYIIEAFGVVLVGLLAYSMAMRDAGMTGAIGILGTLALGAQRLLPAMQNAYANWTYINASRETLDTVLKLLDQPKPTSLSDTGHLGMKFRESLELRNVHYRYSTSVDFTLRNLNLRIEKGECIGLVGSSGAGKSTILDIVMALLPPTNGQLLVDGEPVNETNRRSWQRLIAHVPQVIFLADASIRENIAFGIPKSEIDDERVRSAARAACLDGVVSALENGFDTIVGERGMRLSGGQRQRIGIARALYKRAEMIILDEATNALDPETERSIIRELETLDPKPTILMVTHRLESLRNCTSVLKVEGGALSRSITLADNAATAEGGAGER
jgi:ABC-type bacteriocin/lantibiotic exporter with double-glycine peptidase domain